jgi:hypothetical protein
LLKLQGLGTYAFSIDDAGEIDEENMSDIEGSGSDSGDTERLEARRDAHAGRAEQEQRAQQGVAGPGGSSGTLVSWGLGTGKAFVKAGNVLSSAALSARLRI